MIHLDVAFLPSELAAKSLHSALAVVIDVVRATTTITTALAQGCAFVLPVLHIEEAFELQRQYAQEPHRPLLGGERGGQRVEGFDLGNSPREYTSEVVKNKGIIFSTTNGTRTLLALKEAAPILIGSFLNISAICQYILRHPFQDQRNPVILACSGVVNTFSLEDAVCAGMFVHFLSVAEPDISKTPAAMAAELLYTHYQADLLAMLQNSDGGRRVARIGLAQDLVACVEVDKYPIVPIFHAGKIVLREESLLVESP
ncbi:putative 2-phosphosulfolactate phosphatase [Candidatus Vecturithrix granuli]|uniref:Probable 2-phosphosulfolactate phosphatase n=1 Tax=Vecturithrix granuli TaxID=1499967 RepID=A0A081BZW7_VECG1|nr:putative 2-phosphosulfolactate phosphatase [Candidatus Vecturithrix granuli]